MGEEGKGAAVEDTSKEAKVNLTEYFARYELTKIRREWHDQFEAIARYVVDIFKVCTKLPEEWHHELKSIAKSLVDAFVIMVHVGEEMGSVIQCYTHVIQMIYNVIKALYKCHTVCIYCLRIDSSGIAANTHRHLLACEADRKTKKDKIIHKNTSKSKQHQRHNR